MRWPTATIFVAISVATLFGIPLLPLTGCGHTCYPIGYLCPGATIRVQPAPGQGTGTYLVHIESADATQDFTCSSTSVSQSFSCSEPGQNGRIVPSPDEWTVTFRTQSTSTRVLLQRNGSTIIDESLTLTYENVTPGCGTCAVATRTVNVAW